VVAVLVILDGASEPLPDGASRPLRDGASRPLRDGASRPLPDGAREPLRDGEPTSLELARTPALDRLALDGELTRLRTIGPACPPARSGRPPRTVVARLTAVGAA
jgi:hypothetical protein